VLFSSQVELRIRVRFRFSVWLVRGYAHEFVLLSAVSVALPR